MNADMERYAKQIKGDEVRNKNQNKDKLPNYKLWDNEDKVFIDNPKKSDYLVDHFGGITVYKELQTGRLKELGIFMRSPFKDKNSKRMCVGDIIKIPDDYRIYGKNAGEIYKVVLDYNGVFRLEQKYCELSKGFLLEHDMGVEIIGNIRENPELLQ